MEWQMTERADSPCPIFARTASTTLLEQVAVLALVDGLDVGADQLDAVLLQRARPRAGRSRC